MNRILWFMRHPATSGIFVCTAILASGNLPASAQTAVSPYTIYGIGALDNGNHGSGAGMSGSLVMGSIKIWTSGYNTTAASAAEGP